MRNAVVSPYFDEDRYKGQDVVHQGVRIPLQRTNLPKLEAAEDLLQYFSRRAQRIIGRHWEGMFRVATDADLPALRAIWFDPADNTFPETLGDHIGIVGIDSDGTIVGGALWAPAGAGLFLHQLVANARGKELQMPTRLVWESVVSYIGKYHSLDIGVSYNPKRYEFFKNFAVETYPIILKKPFYVPVIRLSPFRTFRPLKERREHIDWVGNNSTFLPRGSHAIIAALEHLKQDSERREVVIVKTFGSQFITGCVTRAIEKAGYTWKLRGEITGDTRAVLAIHEFGMPVFQAQDMAIVEKARDVGVPVIEDCAWRDSAVWDWSDFKVFSMQKLVDLNYGGVLVGVHLDDEFLWSIGLLDVVKRERVEWEAEQDSGREKRARLWRKYHELVKADGMTPDDCYDYEHAVDSGKWMPTVYLQRFKDDAEADAIVQRLEEFGIQAGHYWGEPVVYLPIHQEMSEAEVEYMFAVVRGYFNLCRDYR